MHYFADLVVKPYIVSSGYRKVAEIGTSYGLNSDKILEIPNLEMTLIDPCFDCDLAEKYQNDPRVTVLKDLSLNVLPTLTEPFDAILIDGDHNWYTVYNELRVIHEHGLLRPGGTIFFHDTGWMYGRRDMYYVPESIPEEFRQPHAKRGLVFGQEELAVEGADGKDVYSRSLHNALHSGGPRNGVKTAIEDFMKEHLGEYCFEYDDDELGLGILLRAPSERANASFEKFAREQRAIRRLPEAKARWKARFPGVYALLKKVAGRA